MVSNTKNKRSENLYFYQILGINYAYDRYYIYMLCGTDIFFGRLCVNSKCTLLIVKNSNIFLFDFIEITFSFLTVLN